MNQKTFLAGLVCLLAPFLANSARAGCVASDVNSQLAITGRNSPAPMQTNNVDVNFGEGCLGNSSHGNNAQTYIGTEESRQERNRTSVLESPSSLPNTMLNIPNVNAEIDQRMHLPVLPNSIQAF